MAEAIKPQKVQAHGNDSWFWAPAIADMSAPTAAEINAVTGLNLSCYLLSEQEGVTSETERVTLPRVLCETSTEEGKGEQKFSLSTLQVVFDPQAATGSAGKKAWEMFKDGANGFLIRRQAVKADSDAPEAIAGQFVDVMKVETDEAVPDKTSTGAEAIYAAKTNVFLKGKPKFNVAVAA